PRAARSPTAASLGGTLIALHADRARRMSGTVVESEGDTVRYRHATWRLAILGWLLVMALGACATRTGTGALVGGGAGAVAGAVIGGDEGAILGGLLGAALGAGVGYHLEREDQRRAAAVLETAPTHHTEVWV